MKKERQIIGVICLSSLVENPLGLKINGEWQEDGPILPLSFLVFLKIVVLRLFFILYALKVFLRDKPFEEACRSAKTCADYFSPKKSSPCYLSRIKHCVVVVILKVMFHVNRSR